jgi:hypothetical protein
MTEHDYLCRDRGNTAAGDCSTCLLINRVREDERHEAAFRVREAWSAAIISDTMLHVPMVLDAIRNRVAGGTHSV